MSDLLIRNFDTPKPGKYTATLQIYEDGAAVLEVTWTRPFEKPRSTSCIPITILPKGHGRLIDADSMLSKFVQDAHGLNGIYDTTDLPEMLHQMPSVVPSEEEPFDYRPELVRCEKCGFKMEMVEVNFFDREGDDHYEVCGYEQAEYDAIVVDVPPNWTGNELDESELPDTIRCPICKKFPFDNTEVQTYDFVRLVMFKGGKHGSDLPVEGGAEDG